jgi:hypothetical protein
VNSYPYFTKKSYEALRASLAFRHCLSSLPRYPTQTISALTTGRGSCWSEYGAEQRLVNLGEGDDV